MPDRSLWSDAAPAARLAELTADTSDPARDYAIGATMNGIATGLYNTG